MDHSQLGAFDLVTNNAKLAVGPILEFASNSAQFYFAKLIILEGD